MRQAMKSSRRQSGIPATIEIGGVHLKIRQVKKLPKGKDGTEIIGYFDSGTSAIRLIKTLDPEAKKFTLLHEVGHAVMWQHSSRLGEQEEEKLCDAFARVVLGLIRHNRELIDWLRG